MYRLKKIKITHSRNEKHVAFTAELHGKKLIAYVSNDGAHPLNTFERVDSAAFNEFKEYCEKLPVIPTSLGHRIVCPNIFVDRIINDIEYRRLCKKKTLVRTSTEVLELDVPYSIYARAYALARYPGCEILNETYGIGTEGTEHGRDD